MNVTTGILAKEQEQKEYRNERVNFFKIIFHSSLLLSAPCSICIGEGKIQKLQEQ